MALFIPHYGARLGTLLAIAVLAVGQHIGAAQSPTLSKADPDGPIKVGILPFADATASGNRTAGTDIARTMQAAMVHSTQLMPRLLTVEDSVKLEEVDGDKAAAVGREQKVDVVFVGTVLEASTEESNKSGWLPSIKGQSGNVQIRRVKATVTLQGELYEAANGRRVFSERVTGRESNNRFGGTLYTRYGSWGNDSYNRFLDSPLGKALQAALAEMTQKIAASRAPARDRIGTVKAPTRMELP